MTDLGLEPNTAASRELIIVAKACHWKNRVGDVAADLSAFADQDMLVRSYENRIFAIFRPTTVAGSPAVEQKTADDVNICTVTAGVRDGQAIEATWFGGPARPGATEACRGATEVVAAALGNLPPAS